MAPWGSDSILLGSEGAHCNYQPYISVQSGGLGRSRGARIGRRVHSAAMLPLAASPAVLKPDLEGDKRDPYEFMLFMNGEAQKGRPRAPPCVKGTLWIGFTRSICTVAVVYNDDVLTRTVSSVSPALRAS